MSGASPISYYSAEAYKLRRLLALRAEGLVPLLRQVGELAASDYDCRQSASFELLHKAATKSLEAQYAFHERLLGLMDKWLIAPRWITLFQQLASSHYNKEHGGGPRPKVRKLG